MAPHSRWVHENSDLQLLLDPGRWKATRTAVQTKARVHVGTFGKGEFMMRARVPKNGGTGPIHVVLHVVFISRSQPLELWSTAAVPSHEENP